MYIRITFPVHGVIKIMGYRNSRGYPVRTTLHNYRTVPPRVLKSIGRRSQQSWLAAQEMGRRYVSRRRAEIRMATTSTETAQEMGRRYVAWGRAEIRMAATSAQNFSTAFGTCVQPTALSFVHTKCSNTQDRLTDPFSFTASRLFQNYKIVPICGTKLRVHDFQAIQLCNDKRHRKGSVNPLRRFSCLFWQSKRPQILLKRF